MAKSKKKAPAKKYQAGGENRASEKRAQSSSATYRKPASPPAKSTRGEGTLRLEKKKYGGMKKGKC